MTRITINTGPQKTQTSLDSWQAKYKEEQQGRMSTKEYINKAVTAAKEAKEAEEKVEDHQGVQQEQKGMARSYNDKTAVLFRDGDLYDDSYDGFGGEWPKKE